MYLGSYAEHCTHCPFESAFSLLGVGHDVGELLGRKLNINVESVAVVLAIDHDLIVGSISLVKQHRFDLGGEYIDSANYRESMQISLVR